MYPKITRFETGLPGGQGGILLLFFFVFQRERRR
jgi:hypothetical protein